MNVNVAAQVGVLRRRFFRSQRARDRVILSVRDQAITQTTLGMRGVRIAQAERKIKCALVILCEDVELAFRRAPITSADFVADGTQAKTNAISAHQLVAGEKQQLSLT